MTEENYRKAIKDAEEEVTRLNLYRASVDRKLAQLKAAIVALTNLLEEPPKAEDATAIGDVGISTAIRQIVREADVGLTPSQVKAKLLESEFDLSKYANSSAVIHNTIKRLEGQGEFIAVKDSSGVTAYAVNPFSRMNDSIDVARAAAIQMASRAFIPQSVLDAMERPITDAQAAAMKQVAEMDKLGKEFLKKAGGLK